MSGIYNQLEFQFDLGAKFGYVNTKTGDYYSGHIENKEMKFKLAGNDPLLIVKEPEPVIIKPVVSYEPEYLGNVIIPWETHYSNLLIPFFSKKVGERKEVLPLYRRRCRLTELNEYYYVRAGREYRIEPHSFENIGKVIPMDEDYDQ